MDPTPYLEGTRAIKKGNPIEIYFRGFLADSYRKLMREEQAAPRAPRRRPIFANLQLFDSLSEPPTGSDPFEHGDVARIIELVCGPGLAEIAHPRHAGRAFTPKAIKTLFHGLGQRDPATARDAGIFVVIREARGRVAASPLFRDSLCRDLLWIRHLPPELSSTDAPQRIPVDDPYAYYFSLIDGVPYAICHGAAPSAQEIRLSGVRVGEDWGSRTGVHSASLSFLRSVGDNPPPVRQVMIEGATTLIDQRGAWQGLMIRPDWHDLAFLELEMETIENPRLIQDELSRIGVLRRLSSPGGRKDSGRSKTAARTPIAAPERPGDRNPNILRAERLAGNPSYLKACFRYAAFPWIHGVEPTKIANYVAAMDAQELRWFHQRIARTLATLEQPRRDLAQSIQAIADARAGARRQTTEALSRKILAEIDTALPQMILASALSFFGTEWFRFAPAQMLLSTDGSYRHARFPRRVRTRLWALSNAGVLPVDDNAPSPRKPLRVRIARDASL